MRREKIKITTLALAITSAFSVTALAQSSGSPAKPDGSAQCMEGMAMPGCPPPDKSKQSTPGMQHQEHKTPSKSPENAQPQQPKQQNDMNNMPGMQHDMGGMQMGTPPKAQSPDTHATMTLQEPENPEHKTGSILPAPELLKDVATRSPMALADFEKLADANNPTLKQASALVRRSQEPVRRRRANLPCSRRCSTSVLRCAHRSSDSPATAATAGRGPRRRRDCPSASQCRPSRCAGHPAD